MYARVLIDNLTSGDLTAEWGLSIYIEFQGHRLLLDTGASDAFLRNADAMGIDLGAVEYGVLSHAHYDHADGMGAFFGRNSRASFYLRRAAQENCYDGKAAPPKYIGIQRGLLAQYTERIVYVDGDYPLLPGVTLVPHKTPHLERIGEQAGMCVEQNGQLLPDDFSHEQSLVLDTEKGLVIFNSCSHGGADNIIREVARTFPGRPIDTLVGGFHLYASAEAQVRALAARIRATGIRQIYTGHCTGEVAMDILRQELGEQAHQLYTGLELTV